MDSFSKLVATFSEDNHARGKQFEELCKWFLENDPLYRAQLEEVWLWDDWPDRWGPDCGIDLIAKDIQGNIWAIQAKCYKPEYPIKKSDIDSFLSESTNKKINNRLLIATTDRMGDKALKVIKRQDEVTPVNQLMLSELKSASIEWPNSMDKLSKRSVKEKYKPRPYQRIAIDKVVTKLEGRGQLIMACGTGKTLTALWITEELKSNTTLVILPSLLLLSSTLKEWLTHRNEPFAFLPVCSDETAARGSDSINLNTSDLAFPSTTDANEIATFLKTQGKKVIFSTYQSTQKITEAFKKEKLEPFDLIIADEAHRCAGKADSSYTLALDDKNIPSTQRLFMTATPKLFHKNFKKRAAESGVDVMSMDDEAVFGPLLHKLTFGEAIEQDLLTDYQVVVVGINNPSFEDMISQRKLVETDNEISSDAQSLASHVGLAKALNNYDLKKVISFHSRVKAASDFAYELPKILDWMPKSSRPSGEVVASHVSGAMPTAQRNQRLQALGEVKENQRYILSNARCLSEGIDVPALDGVAFIDPRNSEIDIVQAVGRAIRLSKNKSVGTIVIPVFINDKDDPDEILNSSPFKKVWAVVNALRSHDELLGEQLDQLRVELGKRGTVGRPDKIVFDLPVKITETFEKALETKLLESTSASWNFWFGLLENYVKRKGDSMIPDSYKTKDGLKLGNWASRQRDLKDLMLVDRRARLDDLGFEWDQRDAWWEQCFEALEDYYREHGDCLVPANYKTEKRFNLGRWVVSQRGQEDTIILDRRDRLDGVGFVWDVKVYVWDQNFKALEGYFKEHGNCLVPNSYRTKDGLRLGNWVSTQRIEKHTPSKANRARLDSLGFDWDPWTTRWEQCFEALEAFYSENGNSLVPASYKTENGLGLGAWVVKQRKDKDKIAEERRARLDNLGFDWDPIGGQFEKGFAALATFFKENGNSFVPNNYKTKDGFNLSGWVGKQRAKKDKISAEHQARLDSLGFDWNPIASQWAQGFANLKSYRKENGNCLFPTSYKTKNGYNLGAWAGRQRKIKDKMSAERRTRLDKLDFVWDLEETRWEQRFGALDAYCKENGDCLVPQRYSTKDGLKLGNWVSFLRIEKDKISVERRARLDSLGFDWDTKATRWKHSFEALEAYYKENGNCLVPNSYRTKDGLRLGNWVGKQRGKRDKMSEERQTRLDRLGFLWDLKKDK